MRVVVVASAELDRAALAALAAHVAPDDDLYVVVPAVEQSRLQWLANDEQEARAEAERVGETIERGAPTDAAAIDVKPDVPRQVVLDAIAEHKPDRVVVALREGEESTWLEEGELDELPGEIDGVPVVHVRL